MDKSTAQRRGPLLRLVLPAMLLSAGAQGALTDLSGQYANAVEESAARANQATFEQLLDSNGGPCNARQRSAGGRCDGAVFAVFASTRELVHTANELTGEGPSEFSLGVDLAGLGTALRWTAGEEFSAQESLTAEFVSGQLSGLASRLSALRGGATGFFIAGLPMDDTRLAHAARPAMAGLGASADSLEIAADSLEIAGDSVKTTANETYSPWGGFLNGSYGYGDREATGNEDAFDFDGFELTAGLDYRFTPNWVAGVMAGYSEREIDFQPVNEFVVDGGMTTDGYSLQAFGLYYSDRWYASLAAGYQDMDFATDRAIKYPSLNPDVASVNTRTLSNTGSTTWTTSASVGYTFNPTAALGLEPYARLEYADTGVDGFTERDINNDGFELQVAAQDIRSLEGIAGVQLRYTATPSFAVITPFITAEYRHQFEADEREIDALYHAAGELADPTSARFSVTTDALDEQYFVLSAGVTTVLRGGRQRTAGGAIYGGLQAFVAYRTVQGMDFYTHDVLSAGLRYEF